MMSGFVTNRSDEAGCLVLLAKQVVRYDQTELKLVKQDPV